MIGDGANRFNANLYNLNAEVEEMQDEGVTPRVQETQFKIALSWRC